MTSDNQFATATPKLPKPVMPASVAVWNPVVVGYQPTSILCILEPDTFLSMLTKAGFGDVELVYFTDYRTATNTTGALFRAIKPG